MCPWTQFPKPLYSLPQRRTGLLAASWNPYPLTSQVSACNYHPQPCPSPLSLTWVYPQTVPTVQSSGSLLTRSCLCWAHCYALTHILMAPLFLFFFFFFAPLFLESLPCNQGFLSSDLFLILCQWRPPCVQQDIQQQPCPLDANSTTSSSCDKQKCLWTSPNVPWGAKSSPLKNHCASSFHLLFPALAMAADP